jgi:hypothetical protein
MRILTVDATVRPVWPCRMNLGVGGVKHLPAVPLERGVKFVRYICYLNVTEY